MSAVGAVTVLLEGDVGVSLAPPVFSLSLLPRETVLATAFGVTAEPVLSCPLTVGLLCVPLANCSNISSKPAIMGFGLFTVTVEGWTAGPGAAAAADLVTGAVVDVSGGTDAAGGGEAEAWWVIC